MISITTHRLHAKELGTMDTGELADNSEKRVLLILEDFDAIRAFYSSHFEQRNYEVFSAVRLADAIDLAEIESPSVIIIDFDLTGEIAENVVRRLHKHSPQSDIIVLGGLDKPEIHKRLIEAGASKHLSKAYDIDMLDQFLEDLVQHN